MRGCEVHAVVTLPETYPTVQQAITLAGKQLKPLVMIAPGFQPDSRIPRDTLNLQSTADSSDITFTGNIHDTIMLPYPKE